MQLCQVRISFLAIIICPLECFFIRFRESVFQTQTIRIHKTKPAIHTYSGFLYLIKKIDYASSDSSSLASSFNPFF